MINIMYQTRNIENLNSKRPKKLNNKNTYVGKIVCIYYCMCIYHYNIKTLLIDG